MASKLCAIWLVEPSSGHPASQGAITARKYEAGTDHKSHAPRRLAPETLRKGGSCDQEGHKDGRGGSKTCIGKHLSPRCSSCVVLTDKV